ncbi:hypothetical protein BH09BAC4_BH09BAC4_23950 [soil metagenome]
MKNVAENFKKFEVTNPDTYTLRHLEYIFSQADKRLEESHKTFESTTTKSVTLITLLVAILTAFTSYFFDKNEIKGIFDAKLTVVFVAICYTYILLIYMLNNILPCDYQPSGSKPSALLKKGQFGQGSKDFDKEDNLKNRYFSEIVNYDFRIVVNFSINTERLNRYNKTVIGLSIMPLFGLVLYYLLSTFL